MVPEAWKCTCSDAFKSMGAHLITCLHNKRPTGVIGQLRAHTLRLFPVETQGMDEGTLAHFALDQVGPAVIIRMARGETMTEAINAIVKRMAMLSPVAAAGGMAQ